MKKGGGTAVEGELRPVDTGDSPASFPRLVHPIE